MTQADGWQVLPGPLGYILAGIAIAALIVILAAIFRD